MNGDTGEETPKTANKAAARPRKRRPDAADYETLAAFRHALRRFLAFSEHAARDSLLKLIESRAELFANAFLAANPKQTD